MYTYFIAYAIADNSKGTLGFGNTVVYTDAPINTEKVVYEIQRAVSERAGYNVIITNFILLSHEILLP